MVNPFIEKTAFDFTEQTIKEKVNHPKHYKKNKYEVIDIIEDFTLNFSRGNVIKYVLRAGEKEEDSLSDIEKEIEDLKKGLWYLNREIERLTLLK